MAKLDKDDFKSLDDKIEWTLLESRRLFFSDVVDNETAKETIRKLWYLELTQPGKPILFIINSPGGSVDAGLAIWDQVKMLSSPVSTLVTGLAASMGSILCLCAVAGKRYATPHAQYMIHQPSIGGPITGQATDLSIRAEQILKTKARLIEIYHQHTGKPHQEIDKALDRDKWMDVREAQEFGLLDKVITSFRDLPL